MASARIARLLSSSAVTAESNLLEFELADGLPLGFVGGQYIIVNTGLPLPGGKVAKRAYSILSRDEEQARFSIAVRRIGSGPGSNYMTGLKAGAEVPFSGPWGQYLPDDSRVRASTIIFATDTGITAALGLLQGLKFKPQLAGAQVVWFVESDAYFLPESFVLKVIPSGCGSFRIQRAPVIGHPERLAVARGAIRTMLNKGCPESAFLSGDGALLYALKDELIAEGVGEGAVRIETFFNHLIRKASAI